MLKLQCKACSYKFDLKNEERIPKRCPYCGKADGIGRVKMMQEWIDQVSDMSESFISQN